LNAVEIDNQTRIAWRDRFTNTASCHASAMRVLELTKSLESQQFRAGVDRYQRQEKAQSR
jgi:hypothetical protein